MNSTTKTTKRGRPEKYPWSATKLGKRFFIAALVGKPMHTLINRLSATAAHQRELGRQFSVSIQRQGRRGALVTRVA